MVLVALMISQKFLDDVPLANSDFVTLWAASGAKKTNLNVNKLARRPPSASWGVPWSTAEHSAGVPHQLLPRAVHRRQFAIS